MLKSSYLGTLWPFGQGRRPFERPLFPDFEPFAGVLDDDIEEENVADDACDERDEQSVQDAVALAFGLIERADPLPTEVVEIGDNEREEAGQPEIPLFLATSAAFRAGSIPKTGMLFALKYPRR